MIKNIKFIIAILTFCFVAVSCEDDSKNPLVLTESQGPFVSIDITNNSFDASAVAESNVSGRLFVPVDNVAEYNLQVSRVSEGNVTDFFPILTVNSFPSDFTITGADLAIALGIEVEDILPGDSFNFAAQSIGLDGTVLTSSLLSDSLDGSIGLANGYAFSSNVACEFIAADVVGTYDVLALGFAGTTCMNETSTTREVVAGPGENQITIIGGEYPTNAGSDDLILNIDPTTGDATLGNPDGIAFRAGSCGIGQNDNYGAANGSVFSCVGSINLTMDFTAFAGNAHPFILQKQ